MARAKSTYATHAHVRLASRQYEQPCVRPPYGTLRVVVRGVVHVQHSEHAPGPRFCSAAQYNVQPQLCTPSPRARCKTRPKLYLQVGMLWHRAEAHSGMQGACPTPTQLSGVPSARTYITSDVHARIFAELRMYICEYIQMKMYACTRKGHAELSCFWKCGWSQLTEQSLKRQLGGAQTTGGGSLGKVTPNNLHIAPWLATPSGC